MNAIGRSRLGGLAMVVVSALLLAGPAVAATAPTATTQPATSIATTSATVTASLNPNGTATTAYFELGTTTAYGTKSPSASVGNGTGNVAFNYTFTDLAPATTYQYRVVGTSTAGTTLGANSTFTTTGAPPAGGPALTVNPASSVTSTGATLSGSVNANGQTTTYYFEYGKTTSYGTKTTALGAGNGTVPVEVSAAISGLTAGQAYHFRLTATSSAGTSHSADATFTAAGGAPATAPSVTTKAASSVTSTSARLNGTVTPRGQVTTFYFEYGTSTGYGTKTPITNAGSGTSAANVSATINGLAPGVYHFRLVASSSGGTTLGSDLTFGSTAPAVQTGSAQG
ncbi:MAG TPA: hypothetical protein VGM80_15890, partial [Gaiellaceae bacterium]